MSKKRRNGRKGRKRAGRVMELAASVRDAKRPAIGTLTHDVAVEEFMDLLIRFRDPDIVLQEAGLSRADLRKLESDDEISAALETRLNACLSTPWRLEPGVGQVPEFVWDQLDPLIETIVTGAWQAVPYGYAVQEAIYRRDPDGRIRWERIEERPFEWFLPTPGGELKYYPKQGGAGIDGKPVDTVFKFFLTRRKPSYRLPMGQALLSRLYWPWFFRTHGMRFWARFLERFGSPLLVGKTVGSTEKMAEMLAQAVQSAVVAIGDDDTVEAVASSGNGEAFRAFQDAIDRSIQKVILGQTLTTDVNGKGSFAAAKVHNEVREDRKLTDLRIITNTVQRMIDAVVALNFPAADPPKFIMEDGTGLEADRAERDAKLANAGIARFTEEYLLRVYDFEPGDFEIPPLKQPAGGKPMSLGAGNPVGVLAASQGGVGKFTAAQAAIEALADQVLVEARAPITVENLRAAVEASRSPDDLAKRLASAYEGSDPAEFNELLERALFAADVFGYVAEEKGMR